VFDAGYSTTANMIGNALLHLLRRGPLTATVAESVDPCAVDELTRVDGVVQAVSRHCLADTELRGRRLRRSDVVIVVLAAANHDPLVFPQPRQFDPTRNPNPHLGFGRGVHSCLGSHFGRRVLCAVFAALGAAPAGRVELAGPWTQRPTATQRGLDRLPVWVR
jgi:cytochrome P450